MSNAVPENLYGGFVQTGPLLKVQVNNYAGTLGMNSYFPGPRRQVVMWALLVIFTLSSNAAGLPVIHILQIGKKKK